MLVNADFHIHSCFSMASSKDMLIKNIAPKSKLKGLGLLGTGDGLHPKWLDIIENSKNINIVEMAADVIGAQMDDPSVAFGFLNGQYASQAGFTGADALLVEAYDPASEAQHGIVNIIAVREADLENELYQHIAKSFQCAEVKEVFDTLYAGTFVPAWTEEAAE